MSLRVDRSLAYIIGTSYRWCLRGHLHYLHFRWKFMKAFMEASIDPMEVSTASIEAFIASMEALHSFHGSVEASVEKISTEDFRGSFYGRYFHGSFRESFHGSFCESFHYLHGSFRESFHGSYFHRNFHGRFGGSKFASTEVFTEVFPAYLTDVFVEVILFPRKLSRKLSWN